MQYFESKYCDIIWNEEVKAVVLQWKGYATSEQFRDIMNKGLELLVSKRGSKWVGDCTKFMTLQKADEDWSNSDWLGRAMQSGIKTIAIVTPEKLIQKNIVDRIIDNNGNVLISTQKFSSVEEALAWLK